METECFIDYLQYSIDWKSLPQLGLQCKPIRNYKIGIENYDGSRSYFGNALTPERALVIYSGKPLARMRHDGLPTLDFIEQIIESGAKISRLDMTIDFYVGDDFLSVDDFREFWQNGLIESRHAEKEPTFYGTLTSEEIKVETLNFGEASKRAKKGMVRVYDTGLTQNFARDIITRIEVEEKREKAHLQATRCCDYGIANVLKTTFDVAHPTWLKGIGTSVAPTHRGLAIDNGSDAMDNRWAWLLMQVAPAMKEAIVHDLAYERYDRILELMDYLDPYEELI